MGTKRGELTPLGDEVEFDGGLIEIADRTWAWLQPNGGLGEANGGLLAGEGESLLLDTPWDAQLTRTMLAEMLPVAEGVDAPITRLLNTHGDGDHWYGNGELPYSVKIYASAAAAEQMREEPPAMLTRLAPVSTTMKALERVPSLPGGAQVRGLAEFGRMLDRFEFDDLHPRLPGSTFETELELDVGGRQVLARVVGPAHSVGDAVVWVPDAKVVYAGDTVFSGVTPIMWAGPVENWIVALDWIESLEPSVIVGGHGPLCDLDDLRSLRDYWACLRDAVAASGPKADPVDLAAELIASPEYERWRGWKNPERNAVNVARIQRTAAGGRAAVGTLERIRLLGSMGALAERLEAARKSSEAA